VKDISIPPALEAPIGIVKANWPRVEKNEREEDEDIDWRGSSSLCTLQTMN